LLFKILDFTNLQSIWMWCGIMVITNDCYARDLGCNLERPSIMETTSLVFQTSDYDHVHVKHICKMYIVKLPVVNNLIIS